MTAAIEIRGVAKRYGAVQALAGVDGLNKTLSDKNRQLETKSG